MLVTVLGCGLYFIGLKRSDLLVAVASGCMLAAAALTTLTVLLTALITVRRWPKETPAVSSLEVNARGWTGLEVRAPRLPLVEVLWTWDAPPQVKVENQRGLEKQLEEVVLPSRRGMTTQVTRRIVVRDVLGISNISWSRTETADLRILPSQGKLQVDSLVQSLFSGDDHSDPRGEPHGDRVDMRRYTPGDPPRLILWKVYARTRKLMVRVPERAVITQPRTCAYLVSGPKDEACAAMMRSVLERDLLGHGWRFGADGNTGYADKREQALTFLARSGNPGVEPAKGLSGFLEQADRDGYQSCLVVIPPVRGKWQQAVAACMSQSRLNITVVSAPAEPGSGSAVERWERLLFYEEEGRPETVDRLFQDLRRKNANFLVYEPGAGRVLPDYQFSAQKVAEKA